MNCETLQFNLSLYLDNEMSSDEKSSIDVHLKQCPICREKLSHYREMQFSFQSFSKPKLSPKFAGSLKIAITKELETSKQKRLNFEEMSEFFKIRLMPYGIGLAVSCLFFAFFLNSLLNLNTQNSLSRISAKPDISVEILKLPTSSIDRPVDTKDFEPITSAVFADRRFAVSKESPSLNPSGSLVNLANNLADDKTDEDEIVLIADVDSDGNATISSFIEPPKNEATTAMLKTALENNKSSAPFVPANLDNRSNIVQIVLLLNQVDVYENKSQSKPQKN
jgi:Putative zinc-finger